MIDTEALRKKVLDLAIRGELVGQDEKDGTARELVDTLHKEKIKLNEEEILKKKKIADGSIIFKGDDDRYYEKDNDGAVKCIDEEIPFAIPNNWEWIRLREICKLIGGNAFKSTEYTDDGVRVIRISDFNEKGLLNNDFKYYKQSSDLEQYIIKSKDILMCMTGGTVGKTCLLRDIDTMLYLNQRVACIRLNEKIMTNEFIYYCLISPYIKKIISVSKSSTNDNISMDIIGDFLIPTPPPEEQKRIKDAVAKIFEFLEEIDNAQDELENDNALLNFKMLDLAVRGKLVPQDSDDESASVLLNKIRDDKQLLFEQGKLKKKDLASDSVIYKVNDGSWFEKLGNDEKCINDEIPFEIPQNWEWVRLKTVCSKIVDGDHNPPKGLDKKTKYIMASSTNINNNKLVELDKVRYLSEEVFKQEDERTQAVKGDILFTSVGTLGRSCIYDGSLNICFQRSVSVISTLINNEYLKMCLDSKYIQKIIDTESTGNAQKGFYLSKLAKLLIPIPPIGEQKRIVDKYNDFVSNHKKI